MRPSFCVRQAAFFTAQELETDDQYFLDLVFETSYRQKIPPRRAMESCFYNARIQLELMRRPIIPSRHASSGGEPGPKKQRTTKKLSNKDKIQEEPELAEYTIKGEKVLRPYHEPGYSNAHGGGGSRPEL